MPFQLRRLAPTLGLIVLLTACGGGGSDAEPDSAPETTGSSSAPAKEEAEPTEPSTPTASEPLVSVVPEEAATGYIMAVGLVGPAFTTFDAAYQKAVKRKDASGVLAAARDLRDAIVVFDKQVRELDLTAVQPTVDTLLDLDAEIIKILDDTASAKTGQAALAALATLPFQAFADAFTGVAEQIRPS